MLSTTWNLKLTCYFWLFNGEGTVDTLQRKKNNKVMIYEYYIHIKKISIQNQISEKKNEYEQNVNNNIPNSF